MQDIAWLPSTRGTFASDTTSESVEDLFIEPTRMVRECGSQAIPCWRLVQSALIREIRRLLINASGFASRPEHFVATNVNEQT
jgi:hypothetical protein